MLVGRLTALIMDHEPGWRLPRRSQLVHRFEATPEEIDDAVTELARRNMIRQTVDGQAYRASPAEHLITLDGLPFLGSRIDPMGNALKCAGRNVLHRAIPEPVARSLRLPPGTPTCAVQTTWDMDGAIAAVSTTYLPAHLAAVLIPAQDSQPGPAATMNPVPSPFAPDTLAARPGALYLEVQAPPKGAARILRLHPTEPAITVTVRLDDPAGAPVALTVAVLHAARFRIALETPEGPLTSASAAAAAPAVAEHLTRKAR